MKNFIIILVAIPLMIVLSIWLNPNKENNGSELELVLSEDSKPVSSLTVTIKGCWDKDDECTYVLCPENGFYNDMLYPNYSGVIGSGSFEGYIMRELVVDVEHTKTNEMNYTYMLCLIPLNN